jgi:hypothetical protein
VYIRLEAKKEEKVGNRQTYNTYGSRKKKKKKNGKLKKISFDVLMMFQLLRFATKLTSQFSTVFKTI